MSTECISTREQISRLQVANGNVEQTWRSGIQGQAVIESIKVIGLALVVPAIGNTHQELVFGDTILLSQGFCGARSFPKITLLQNQVDIGSAILLTDGDVVVAARRRVVELST